MQYELPLSPVGASFQEELFYLRLIQQHVEALQKSIAQKEALLTAAAPPRAFTSVPAAPIIHRNGHDDAEAAPALRNGAAHDDDDDDDDAPTPPMMRPAAAPTAPPRPRPAAAAPVAEGRQNWTAVGERLMAKMSPNQFYGTGELYKLAGKPGAKQSFYKQVIVRLYEGNKLAWNGQPKRNSQYKLR